MKQDLSLLSNEQLIDLFQQRRDQVTRFHNMQQAKKVALNSAYGSLANAYYRWHDTRFAEAITLSGQLSIRWVERHINKYLNGVLKTEDVDYVIAIDTDSLYINLGPLVNKIMPGADDAKIVRTVNKICVEKLQPVINEAFKTLGEYTNCYRQKLEMKREAIASKAIWTGKKHYALNVYALEEVMYDQPELKVAGIEAVRSSTPAVVRQAIKQTLSTIMNGDEATTQQFIEQFETRFKQLPFEDVAFPRSVNFKEYASRDTIYGKRTPIGPKAALIYNHWVRAKNLDNKYPLIQDGEKIKFAYLRRPNPIGQDVVGVSNVLPPELGLHPYIDYGLQFEKTYLTPIRSILDAIGWNAEPTMTF